MESDSAAAIAAVGAQGPMDWDLKPETHAASLPAAAAPLKRILARPELQEIIGIYQAGDRNAKVSQATYRRLATTAALSGFAAVVLGGLMLLPSDKALPAAVAKAAPVLQFLFLATSIVSSLTIAIRKPFVTWMHERAKAENARIGLFKAVLAADEPPQAGELGLLPLQLEYFRRYQLEVQRSYYKGRGGQHARAMKRAGLLRALALLLAGLAGLPLLFTFLGPDRTPDILNGVMEFFSSPAERAERILLCTSVIGGGIQGLLASYGLLSQSERNAARYLDTARNLEDLAARPLDDARSAAAAGDRESVLAFAALVHDQISSEHREWIALRALAPDLSLGKLKSVGLPQLR